MNQARIAQITGELLGLYIAVSQKGTNAEADQAAIASLLNEYAMLTGGTSPNLTGAEIAANIAAAHIDSHKTWKDDESGPAPDPAVTP